MDGPRSKAPDYSPTPAFLVEPEATTPRHNGNKRGASKRKQTILNLLHALNELTDDEETSLKGRPVSIFRTCVQIDISVISEPNLESGIQDDRNFREFPQNVCMHQHGESLGKSIATVDEQLQTAGAETFAKLERQAVAYSTVDYFLF